MSEGEEPDVDLEPQVVTPPLKHCITAGRPIWISQFIPWTLKGLKSVCTASDISVLRSWNDDTLPSEAAETWRFKLQTVKVKLREYLKEEKKRKTENQEKIKRCPLRRHGVMKKLRMSINVESSYNPYDPLVFLSWSKLVLGEYFP